jgi:hypothetical protein
MNGWRASRAFRVISTENPAAIDSHMQRERPTRCPKLSRGDPPAHGPGIGVVSVSATVRLAQVEWFLDQLFSLETSGRGRGGELRSFIGEMGSSRSHSQGPSPGPGSYAGGRSQREEVVPCVE